MLVSVTVALTHQCYIYIENRLLFILVDFLEGYVGVSGS